MSFLKQLIQEAAAGGSTGAGSIAGARGSLFGGGNEDPKKVQKRQRKMMRRVLNYRVIGEGLGITSGETEFDAADVISKIDAAEKKANVNKDTVVFGLEDEDGGLVKVYVKSDQADEFETALSSLLAGEDENEDDENSAMEIAEVLFKLKDRFEIVDVDWPTIEGDEEEEQEVADPEAEGDMGDTGEDIPAEDIPDEADLGAEGDGTDMAADEEAAKSALQQVIDVLKADADAKKAEAEAKTAEAKAKEAEYSAQAASAKVKQEEEILDMETYYKEKADKEKEAKQLAKLAKYKHDKATDAETSLSFESVDDDDEDDSEISMEELADLIFKNLRAN